ncbi:ribonuclease HII [Candidatus Berkiella aquae]|uniref:Ribonuclease HII n=1 Tax=Candidatus Berkiella aquae TaxID=295108 RepID=A0A0Q9YKD3_9GAMM|nr:ribonuclease HII [Candidatus Berkiella aquae]MCS5711167.1 ribonuclease HII [Candidatus Berkiella aquae]
MTIIAGVDEVGRGPLAGPVLAAAVILNNRKPIEGLRDSKKLTDKKREELAHLIKQQARCWAIGIASVPEIDSVNILNASLLAMKRAIENLSLTPKLALIDGNRCPNLIIKSEAIIGGDDLIAEISAASIIAKVARDKIMSYFDKSYPDFGFGQHKGYGTQKHLLALQKHGVTPLHRKSFAPVKALCLEVG